MKVRVTTWVPVDNDKIPEQGKVYDAERVEGRANVRIKVNGCPVRLYPREYEIVEE